MATIGFYVASSLCFSFKTFFFYPFKLLFFPAAAPLCTKRRREVGFIVGVA
jgi:hypothetical protein